MKKESNLLKKRVFIGALVFMVTFASLTIYGVNGTKKMPQASPSLLTSTVTDSMAFSDESIKNLDGTTTITAKPTPIKEFVSKTDSDQREDSFLEKDSDSNIDSAKLNVPAPVKEPTVVKGPTPISISGSGLKSSKIVGYYAAWSTYSGFTPNMIDANKLTHINYAFANIGSDLKITMGYPDIDESNFNKLNTLKAANPNLKTIISVGGWTWSGRFSDVVLSDSSRAIFADSCVDFMVRYGFDGVDIDWEYPVSGGLSTNVRRPEDKTNFTYLMKILREKLDDRELVDGKDYLLTFAGATTTSYLNNIELTNLEPYIDYANVMTYDIHGNWETYTDFNAPLYGNNDSTSQFKWSVDAGIKTWQKSGFPSSKIVMGVPFYGHLYKGVSNNNNGLYQTYQEGLSISYKELVSSYINATGWNQYYHSESMIPWLFDGSTFISYEDESSISLKAQYINSLGLGGAMIWELSQDSNSTLLNSLYHSLK
ncbi:MAG TPA: glycoside hydrolase family 18 protein [Lachnospiraceae bacterium]|nr:glycoside hydrolase family 18 protein [Lachnospiraceae bacterium]